MVFSVEDLAADYEQNCRPYLACGYDPAAFPLSLLSSVRLCRRIHHVSHDISGLSEKTMASICSLPIQRAVLVKGDISARDILSLDLAQ